VRAEERGAGVEVSGLVVAVHAECGQEVGQHLEGLPRFAQTEASEIC
jgi:hypothetical protein